MTESVTRARTRRRPRFLLVQVGLVAVLVGLVWYGFGSNVLKPGNQPVMPSHLGRLELQHSSEGKEAMAQVDKLHGTGISLVNAYIGEYSNRGDDRVTVWVGEAANMDAAASLLQMMVDGIKRGGAGFSNLRQVTVAGRDVWQVDGPGGKHFFYGSGKPDRRVVWLTIQASDAAPPLELAVKIF